MLNSEPWFLLKAGVEDLLRKLAEVGTVWLCKFDVIVCFTEHEDVRSSSEWIVVHSNRLQEDFGIVSGSLFGAGTIVVPRFEVLDLADSFAVVKHFCLASQLLLSAQPDVLSKDCILWCFVL